MRSQTPFNTILGPVLLLGATLPAPLNGASTTTVVITLTRTITGPTIATTTSVPPATPPGFNNITMANPSDGRVTICSPTLPALPTSNPNETSVAPGTSTFFVPTANDTLTGLLGEIPRNTSTTCAHSMSHFVPTADSTLTTLPSPVSSDKADDSTGILPVTDFVFPDAAASGDGNNVNGFMHPAGGPGKDEDKGNRSWAQRLARWVGRRQG